MRLTTLLLILLITAMPVSAQTSTPTPTPMPYPTLIDDLYQQSTLAPNQVAIRDSIQCVAWCVQITAVPFRIAGGTGALYGAAVFVFSPTSQGIFEAWFTGLTWAFVAMAGFAVIREAKRGFIRRNRGETTGEMTVEIEMSGKRK